jgi:hypothetical protein
LAQCQRCRTECPFSDSMDDAASDEAGDGTHGSRDRYEDQSGYRNDRPENEGFRDAESGDKTTRENVADRKARGRGANHLSDCDRSQAQDISAVQDQARIEHADEGDIDGAADDDRLKLRMIDHEAETFLDIRD